MLIGELARQTGLRTSALRYYEQIGVLPVAHRQGGRRVYGPEALDRLAFVRFAQACGFRLDEIALLLDGGADSPMSRRLRALAADKLVEMDRAIERARAMKRFLAASLDCRCVSADECGRLVRSHEQARQVAR